MDSPESTCVVPRTHWAPYQKRRGTLGILLALGGAIILKTHLDRSKDTLSALIDL